MPHARPAFRLGLVLSLLLGLLVGVTSPVQAAGGDLVSWGYNAHGQLGDGSTDTRTLPVSVTPDFPDEVVEMAGGFGHSLVLLADGTVWAWGWNNVGQLGNGDAAGDSLVPTLVQGLPVITAISAGAAHSMALDVDGNVWTWGSNGNSQLGLGPSAPSIATTPTRIVAFDAIEIVDIAAGAAHALALDTNGTVYAWGNNSRGELGDGSTTDQPAPTPVTFPPDTNIDRVAAGPGANHSFAITTTGTLYGWGANFRGQAAPGSTSDQLTPAVVAGVDDVVDVGGGDRHTLVLTATGEVYGWGENTFGQVGTGTEDVLIATPTLVLTGATAIAVGTAHSLALDENGMIQAWGSNQFGQLGDGTTSHRRAPTPVQSTRTFTTIAAAEHHSLASLDLTPPTTTATVNGEAPNDGWYQSATVTLIADEPATTTYEVDANATQTYTDPFPLPDGEHTITYRSTDPFENVEDDQTLTVKVDSTAPSIQPIQSQMLDPVSPAGAPVFFTLIVADLLTPTDDLLVTCVDQFDNPFTSGQYAPIGTTTITCTVTDLAGNTASTSFTVTVQGVGDLFGELRSMIAALGLDSSMQQTLLTQVNIAELLANGSQPGLTCVQLTNLDLQITSQESRRRIDRRDAAAIYTQTQQIRSVIGCGGMPG